MKQYWVYQKDVGCRCYVTSSDGYHGCIEQEFQAKLDKAERVSKLRLDVLEKLDFSMSKLVTEGEIGMCCVCAGTNASGHGLSCDVGKAIKGDV